MKNLKSIFPYLILLAVLIGNSCVNIKTYDARIEGKEILIPAPAKSTSINGPAIYGCTPGKPLVYKIPTQGEHPMEFSAEGLPSSLMLDAIKGILTGMTPDKRGEFKIKLIAENEYGKDSKEWTLVVGDIIALTPPMGWNHWYTHYHYITDEKIRKAAGAMVSSGMADVGYSYVSIDDCWMRITGEWAEKSTKGRKTASVGLDINAVAGETRDAEGRIITNSNFQDMAALTDFIHVKGLKAGIYTSPGPRTCQQFEGSWQHEAIDAETYAEWGFDLLKYDWCHYSDIFNELPESEQSLEEYMKPFKLMNNLLRNLSRDILHNLCQYGMANVWEWGKETGQSWRIGGDLGHTLTEGGVYKIAEKTIQLRNYNGPGGWNDPDYLILGKLRSPFNKGGQIAPIELTPNEQYSYISLWYMMACPLFFSGDMSQIDDFTRNLLCNNELIAVNQDRLGLRAEPVLMNDQAWVLKKLMSDGSVIIGFFDIANTGDQEIPVTWSELGLTRSHSARDLWRQKDLGISDENLSVIVGPHGCAIIQLDRKCVKTTIL